MFLARGSDAGSILATGPTMTIDQSGRAAANERIKLQVDAFVDDAVIAENRPGNSALIGGGGNRLARSGEMLDVNA